MAIAEGEVAGIPARVCRVSFSGELAFEVNVDGRRGLELWEAIHGAGEVTPYGTEAMHVLRAEKGYPIVGQDTDGTVTPQDLGMDWIVSKTKPDFLGKRSFARADTSRPDRKQLVGLLPVDRETLLPEGTQLVAAPGVARDARPRDVELPQRRARPHVRARARLRSGRERIGETIYADGVAAEVADPVLYDKEGSAPRWPSCVSSRRRRRSPSAASRSPGSRPSRTRRPTSTSASCSGSAPTSGSCSAATEADFPDAAAAVDVSANRVAFELVRSRTRPRCSRRAARSTSTRCAPGGCAQTLLARAQVILYRAEPDAFGILVRPSFADYLRAWLRDATA